MADTYAAALATTRQIHERFSVRKNPHRPDDPALRRRGLLYNTRGQTRPATFEIAELIDRVIIGPSNYPIPIGEAFVAALQEAGMKDAATRVFASNIPLRT